MHVSLRNPRTGEVKPIKVGWSWTLLFFTSFFGVPLFIRRLYVWGGVFLFLCLFGICQSWASGAADSGDEASSAIIGLCVLGFHATCLGLNIYIAAKGNELTAKNYLEQGWVFASPNSPEATEAKRRWNIQEVFTPVQSPASTPNPPGSNLKKCPFCAEDVQAAAIKCKHCGSNLSQEQAV